MVIMLNGYRIVTGSLLLCMYNVIYFYEQLDLEVLIFFKVLVNFGIYFLKLTELKMLNRVSS